MVALSERNFLRKGAKIGLLSLTLFAAGCSAGSGSNANSENNSTTPPIRLQAQRTIDVVSSDGNSGEIIYLNTNLLGVHQGRLSQPVTLNNLEEIVGLVSRECPPVSSGNILPMYGAGNGFTDSGAFIFVKNANECMDTIQRDGH
jgi:hypothetical protein